MSSKPKPNFHEDNDEWTDDEIFEAALQDQSANSTLSEVFNSTSTNIALENNPESDSEDEPIKRRRFDLTPESPLSGIEEQDKIKVRRVLFSSSEEETDKNPSNDRQDHDLTNSTGLILGSDDSSEIDSLHSSDIDFIDDTNHGETAYLMDCSSEETSSENEFTRK